MESSDIEIENYIDNDNYIDNSWINDLENEEANYNDFYKTQQAQITCYILCIDHLNNISKIKKDSLRINNNKIDSCEIAFCFEKNRKKSYMLSNILVFNVDVTTDDVISGSIDKNYLTSHSPFSDIYIEQTISMFHKVNTVFIFAKEQYNNKTTRKVYINTKNNNTRHRKIRKQKNV